MLGSRLVVLPLSTSRKGRDELASLLPRKNRYMTVDTIGKSLVQNAHKKLFKRTKKSKNYHLRKI